MLIWAEQLIEFLIYEEPTMLQEQEQQYSLRNNTTQQQQQQQQQCRPFSGRALVVAYSDDCWCEIMDEEGNTDDDDRDSKSNGDNDHDATRDCF